MRKQFNLGKREIISFVGGGGKTTTIERLALDLAGNGNRVLSTTTTAILIPSRDKYNQLFIGSLPKDYLPAKGSITVFGEYVENGEIRSNNLSLIDELINKDIFDYCLIEADGSKGKPIKAPNENEPVISKLTTVTVGVIGLDCIGKRVDEIAHRPDLLKDILEVLDDHLISYGDILKLVKHNNGLFKNSRGRRILLLNKVRDEQMQVATRIAEELKDARIKVIIEEFK